MKRMWMLCLAAGLLLTGCSECGLGGRAIVEGVYLEKNPAGYEANLLVTKTEPSAEAGDLDEEILCVTGKGSDLFSALSAAEKAENRQLFYGQNERLFLNPEISGSELFETCRLLEQETRGRPNTAVYQLDLKEDDPDWKTLLEEVSRLEEKDGYKSSLYALAAGRYGVLPRIVFDGEKAAKAGLLLCDEQGTEAAWNGADSELAVLLAQHHRDLFLELPLDEETVRFRVRSPKLGWQVSQTPKGPKLKVSLLGRIDQLTSSGEGDDKKQLTNRLNREIEERLRKLSEDSFEAGRDVFGFTAWFCNWNEKETRRLSRAGLLEQADRVEFESRLYQN